MCAQPSVGSSSSNPLKISDKLLIFLFVFSNFMEGTFFSFLGSFFQQEIVSKGLTSKDVGIITAMYPLACIISSFGGGYLLKYMKLRTMYMACYLVSSGILIPFAFVLDIDNVAWFYACCVLCRIVQGIGSTGIELSTMIIITSDYKQYLGTLVGITSTTFGIGCAFGPFYSGLVYQYVGTKSVFFSLAAISLIFQSAAIFFLKPKCDEQAVFERIDQEEKSKNDTTLMEFIRIFELLIPLSAKMVTNLTSAFFDNYIAIFLNNQFDFNSVHSGTIMMAGPIVFMVGSMLTGTFIDRYGHSKSILVLGLLLYILYSLIAGPVPFLRINTTLFTVLFSNFSMEMAGSFVLISSTTQIFSILRENNIEETDETNNRMNSFMIVASNFGNLIGSVTGGLLIDVVGYKMAPIQSGAISLIILCFEAIYFFKRGMRQRKNMSYEKIETSS